VFISVLTGAFMFTADLLKHITIPSEVSFIRVSSYHGTASTGTVLQVLGLKEEIKDRTVVVLEDIVDTGNTMISLMNILKSHQPAEVKVATLLFKPAALKYKVNLDYVGFEVPNDFLVGYGLDYDGLGRNLNDICTLVIEK
jgi:hypoxanthine phosphoribosyltransferase